LYGLEYLWSMFYMRFGTNLVYNKDHRESSSTLIWDLNVGANLVFVADETNLSLFFK